jgi:hypothetical protein
MSSTTYYILQDAIHNVQTVSKSSQDLERMMLRIDRFMKVPDAMEKINAAVDDEKVEFAQFSVIKTSDPMKYIQ